MGCGHPSFHYHWVPKSTSTRQVGQWERLKVEENLSRTILRARDKISIVSLKSANEISPRHLFARGVGEGRMGFLENVVV